MRMCAGFAASVRSSDALPVVVCNAGVGAPGPTDSISADAFDSVMSTNVRGVGLTFREVLRIAIYSPYFFEYFLLKMQKEGRISPEKR